MSGWEPSPQQRESALAVANGRRDGLIALKRAMKSGELLGSDATLDPRCATMMVGDFLACLPRCGPMRTRKMLGELARSTEGEHEVKLWPWSRMRDLTDRQRKALQFYLMCKERCEPVPGLQPVSDPPYRVKSANGEHIEARAIVNWVRSNFPGASASDVERTLGFSSGAYRRWLSGDQDRVRLTVLDEAFSKIGRPDLLHDLIGT